MGFECVYFRRSLTPFISGKWKSSSIESWNKQHKLLWPTCDVPTLLESSAVKKGKDENPGATNQFFVENTIPTSMLFAALCSQITAARSPSKYRYAASKLLFELLQKMVQSCDVKARFSSDGTEFQVNVPTSGMFPSSILCAMSQSDSSQNTLKQLKRAWNKDAQDPGCQFLFQEFTQKYYITVSNTTSGHC